MIQSEIEERVRRHVADVLDGCIYERISVVEQFSEGERHQVFKVTFADGSGEPIDVVVRIASEDETRDCAYATREARVLDVLQGHGAPRLLDFRCSGVWIDEPTLCMQHIAGASKSAGELQPSDLEKLGQVIALAHRVETGPL